MVNRSLTVLVVLFGLAGPVQAGPVEDKLIASLRAQGFEDIETERTWLGRLRIEAENDAFKREIVIDPRTGEILRDFWLNQNEDDEDDEDAGGWLRNLFDPRDGED